jgi:hypothetical protein
VAPPHHLLRMPRHLESWPVCRCHSFISPRRKEFDSGNFSLLRHTGEFNAGAAGHGYTLSPELLKWQALKPGESHL